MEEASLRSDHGGRVLEESSWGHLGGIWRQLRDILEASGNHLGVIWQASWRHLERPGSLLESKRHRGGILELSTVGFPPSLSKENRKLNIEYYKFVVQHTKYFQSVSKEGESMVLK